jgi:hypothetical protein
MNKVKLILADGNDELIKIADMTDVQIEYLSKDKVINLLGRDMKVSSLYMTDSKWVAKIDFKREYKKDDMSKAEFVKLLNDGWSYAD